MLNRKDFFGEVLPWPWPSGPDEELDELSEAGSDLAAPPSEDELLDEADAEGSFRLREFVLDLVFLAGEVRGEASITMSSSPFCFFEGEDEAAWDDGPA